MKNKNKTFSKPRKHGNKYQNQYKHKNRPPLDTGCNPLKGRFLTFSKRTLWK